VAGADCGEKMLLGEVKQPDRIDSEMGPRGTFAPHGAEYVIVLVIG